MTQTADIIILNGRVLTLDEDRPRAEAVAMAAGHILAVGTVAQIETFRDAGTQVIDAAGGTVLPGFSENHMHLFSGAAELDHLQLAGVSGLAALTEAVRLCGGPGR
jgi:predicted amidohydrolase YtcJ